MTTQTHQLAKKIYNWFKQTDEYVRPYSGDEDDMKSVCIDGGFNLLDLASFLTNQLPDTTKKTDSEQVREWENWYPLSLEKGEARKEYIAMIRAVESAAHAQGREEVVNKLSNWVKENPLEFPKYYCDFCGTDAVVGQHVAERDYYDDGGELFLRKGEPLINCMECCAASNYQYDRGHFTKVISPLDYILLTPTQPEKEGEHEI